MAELFGNLWDFNLARVRVIDVTDDYKYMQPPLPSECYPVLAEMWVPVYDIDHRLAGDLIAGYLYDWHQSPEEPQGTWYVGVVDSALLGTGLATEIATG